MSDRIISRNFTFTDTSIEGVKIVGIKAYGDDRGYFVETYKRPDIIAGGIDCEFVQDNQSSSTRGVLRGLHFQIEHPQASSRVLFQARFLMWRLTCTKIARRMASGREWCFLLRTSASFLFLVGSRTASSFYPILPSFATNVMMSTILTMKAGSCGTTPPSESSGLRSMATPSLIQPRSS